MSGKEVFNFSAGPAVIPQVVLYKAQQELLDYHGTGLSVMTMSHRSDVFLEILYQTKTDLVDLLGIPDDYTVLFLQGGASLQFTDIVLNLSFSKARRIACVVSGNWSKIAYQQMSKIDSVSTMLAASSECNGEFLDVPGQHTWQIEDGLDFIHFTSNETAHGVQYQTLPSSLDKDYPLLVCDMSSDLLSRTINISDYGLIYAGAQKNIGPAGVTIVILKKELLERSSNEVPDVLNYRSHFNKNGMYNTPNTFGVYICGLVMKWVIQQGGIPKMAEVNTQKASLLYRTIDESGGFYVNHIQKSARSQMNVIFNTPTPELDSIFVAEAERENLRFLKGYKSLGGMRASIYNAMPLAGVEALCYFMQDFQARYA